MAADDSKIKFLPRHLQRSQPATSQKSKRRVTVEDSSAGDEESDRRSVFERLGPGGPQRNEKSKYDYGANIQGRSKKDGDRSPDNLRLKFKDGGKDKDTKVRSTVVPLVKKGDGGGSDANSAADSDNWSIDHLEDKKERELEQKRKEIQRALLELDDGNDGPDLDAKKTDSSGSDSSPERPQKKKKEKGKKKEKKKHKKAAAEKEVTVERLGKRKYGSDVEETPHKKKKKKNKDKKHQHHSDEEEEPSSMAHPPPPLSSMELGGGGGRKHQSLKSSAKPEPQLYEPDSPTSSPTRAETPEVKSKGKKKKKKKSSPPAPEPVQGGKSKKLMSPLKKVLKLKKGPASVTSSKMSRSESRDREREREPVRRKQSRSSSRSSSASSSPSPDRGRGRHRAASPEQQKNIRGRGEKFRVKSKSVERKKKPQQRQQQTPSPSPQQRRSRQHRSKSSSSSMSASDSSSDRDSSRRHIRGKGNRFEQRETGHHATPQKHNKRSVSPDLSSAGRKDARLGKRKREDSQESWNRSKEKKTGRIEAPERQRQGQGKSGVDIGTRNVSKERGRRADQQRDEVKGQRGHATSKDRGGGAGVDRNTSKERLKRGTSVSRDKPAGRNKERERSRENDDRDGGRRERGREERNKDDSRERGDRGGDGFGQNKDRDRSEDQGRRMDRGGGNMQQGDRRGRMLHRPGDMDNRGRRGFRGGPGGNRGGGQYGRQEFDRGPMSGGMGRDWEDDRDNRDNRRDGDGDWGSGRDGRNFGGGMRDEGGNREFGRGALRRDDRIPFHMRGGRGRGGMMDRRMMRSGSQDRFLQRDFGDRDKFGGNDGERDRERRAGSQDRTIGRGRDNRDGGGGGRGGFRDGDRSVDRGGDRSVDRGGDRSVDRGGDRDEGSKNRGRDGVDRDARAGGDRDSRAGGDRDSRAGGDRDSRAGGDRDSRASDESRDREKRGRDTSRSDKARGRGGSEGSQSPEDGGRGFRDEGHGRKVSIMKSSKSDGKDNSPSATTKDESSLAALFDQSESSAQHGSGMISKKKQVKTFGGKKSPQQKQNADSAADSRSGTERGRSSMVGRDRRLGGRRVGKISVPSTEKDKKVSPARKATEKEEPEDSDKISAGKKDDRTSQGSQSPRGSQQSGKSRPRSPRRSSHSPTSKRTEDAGPSAKRSSSVGRHSKSPAPLSTSVNKDRGLRKKVEHKKETAEKPKGSDKGKRREKSETPTDIVFESSPGAADRKRRKSSESGESLAAKVEGGDIAAAMLGDGLEDGQQDVFSDWSDDDDTFNDIIDVDSMKNRVEDLDYDYGGPRGYRDSRGRRGDMMGHTPPQDLMMLGGLGPSGDGGDYHEGEMGVGRDFPYNDSPNMRYGDDGPDGRYMDGRDFNGRGPRGGMFDGGFHRLDEEGRARVDALLAKPALEKNLPDVKIVEDVQKEKPARERRRRNTGEEGYEEISSDENDLDDEGERVPKRTIVSILDIDMSSLIQATKSDQAVAAAQSGRRAVFHRYKACSIFAQIGISKRLAGNELFAQVQDVCQKQMDEDFSEAQALSQETKADLSPSTMKTDSKPVLSDSNSLPPHSQTVDSGAKSEPTSKQERQDSETVDTAKDSEFVTDISTATKSEVTKVDSPSKMKRPEFKLFGDSPAEHTHKKAQTLDRSTLLSNFGLFRRALTARKDLDIRRQLCRIDQKYDQSAIYPSGLVDPDMFRHSLNLLRQKKATMLAACKVGSA